MTVQFTIFAEIDACTTSVVINKRKNKMSKRNDAIEELMALLIVLIFTIIAAIAILTLLFNIEIEPTTWNGILE